MSDTVTICENEISVPRKQNNSIPLEFIALTIQIQISCNWCSVVNPTCPVDLTYIWLRTRIRSWALSGVPNQTASSKRIKQKIGSKQFSHRDYNHKTKKRKYIYENRIAPVITDFYVRKNELLLIRLLVTPGFRFSPHGQNNIGDLFRKSIEGVERFTQFLLCTDFICVFFQFPFGTQRAFFAYRHSNCTLVVVVVVWIHSMSPHFTQISHANGNSWAHSQPTHHTHTHTKRSHTFYARSLEWGGKHPTISAIQSSIRWKR